MCKKQNKNSLFVVSFLFPIILQVQVERLSKTQPQYQEHQRSLYDSKETSKLEFTMLKTISYLSCTAIFFFFTAGRFRLLKHTRLTLVAFLNELPKTQHDINLINVDVNTYTVSSSMILTLLSLELFTIVDILLFSGLFHRALY